MLADKLISSCEGKIKKMNTEFKNDDLELKIFYNCTGPNASLLI